MGGPSIDNEWYRLQGERWYEAMDDPLTLLRAENRFKIPWVMDELLKFSENTNLRILDMGCGGGFLTTALAQQGYEITGLDIHPENLNVARSHDTTGSGNFICGDARSAPFPSGSFDAVSILDLLEHVEDPEAIIKEASRLLIPGGLLLFHTFNRNPVAYIAGVKSLDTIVKNRVPGIHEYRLFIKPRELKKMLDVAGFTDSTCHGIRPGINRHLFRFLFTGKVDDHFTFTWTSLPLVSYAGIARKELFNVPL